MSFIETPRFPDDISYGSTGGPSYNTDVITVKSGHEYRNQNWVQSRSKYDAAFGIRNEEQLSELISFFHAMAGMTHGFRFKDWGDYKSCSLSQNPSSSDQSLGFGDDVKTEFQIIKKYTAGIFTERDITKPISGTVLVEVDGSLNVENSDYTIDYTTGIITFSNAPLLDRGDGSPEEVKCGYEFDVPCRFNSDELNINFEAYLVGSTTVPIIEIRTD